jgi:hypothetical protein
VSGPSLFLIALACATSTDDLVQRSGRIEARLCLDVPAEGVEATKARVQIDVVVTGPADLEVSGPRLEDSLAAWRVAGRASSWREQGGDCVIVVSMTLEQTEGGVMPLPGVVLLVREGPSGDWRELAWPDLLRDPREAKIEQTEAPPPSPWPGRLGVVALFAVVALAALLLVRRVLKRKTRPVPAHVRALRHLGEARVSPARAEVVVREFLDERFGLTTRRQTSREMLGACAALPQEAREALGELSSRAEMVKFAGLTPDEAERLKAIELARRVIGACSTLPVGQEAAAKENTETGAGR